jgi:hypothetical protein
MSFIIVSRRDMEAIQARDASRGSLRSLAAQRTLARDDKRAEIIGSAFVGQHVADAGDHIALVGCEGEEFEAVAEAVAITDDCPHFQRIWTERKRNLEGDDFAGFEFAGERGSDAVLADFGGVSPAILKFSVLEHADMQAGI